MAYKYGLLAAKQRHNGDFNRFLANTLRFFLLEDPIYSQLKTSQIKKKYESIDKQQIKTTLTR